MYRLINIQDKKHITYNTSKDLVDLWVMLDMPQNKHKEMVILNDNNEIIAGKNTAWDRSKQLNFNINNEVTK